MKCPHCNEYVPDNNYICPHCSKVLQPDKEPADYIKKSISPPRMNTNMVIVLVILVGIAILVYAAISKAKPKEAVNNEANAETTQTAVANGVINSANPGEELDINKFIQTGKTNIFDFYSEFCPPCRRISPLLEKLAQKRDDIVVHKIDINRPNVRGIDWTSPLARQYSLRSIPHFKIYDSSGHLAFEDKPAYLEVERLLKSESLIY